MLTDPIRFTLGEQHVTSATSSYSSAVGTISGIVASILAILLAVAAIVFYRRHRSHHGKAGGNGNVAFENPTYTRGLEQVQVCIMCVCACVWAMRLLDDVGVGPDYMLIQAYVITVALGCPLSFSLSVYLSSFYSYQL